MKKYLFSRFILFSLKLLSMLAKFILIIYLGKNLGAEALGEYGLFFTTILIATYFLGMDFYVFTNREIIYTDHKRRLTLIRDQFIFHLIVYIVVLPLLFSVFILGIINYKYITLFYLILITEHLSQEIFRLYTVLNKQIFANVLLFLRTGVWVYLLILFWIYGLKCLQNLYSVYTLWFLGNLLSIILGFYYLFSIYNKKTLKTKVNWIWIKSGFKISFSFFIGTLAYKLIEFSDRYMINHYMTKSDVGIYTFFGSIANTLNTLVYTLVIMMYYPKLIDLYKDGKVKEFTFTLKKFFKEILIYSLLITVGIILFIHPVLEYMNKIKFAESINILWILIASNLILNISFIPHYVLYAQHKDLVIRNITILGAILNVILNIILIPKYGLYGAAFSTFISFCIILVLKIITLVKGKGVLKLTNQK